MGLRGAETMATAALPAADHGCPRGRVGSEGQRHLWQGGFPAVPAPAPIAHLRTLVRRHQRQQSRVAARSKIEEQASLIAALRQLLACSAVADADGLSSRERALLEAHRWHLTACHRLGRDVHCPASAVQAAGLGKTGATAAVQRGAVARHHGAFVLRVLRSTSCMLQWFPALVPSLPSAASGEGRAAP